MKSIRLMASAVAAGLLLASLSIATGPALAQLKLRIGYVVVPIHMAPLIYQVDEASRNKGKSYTAEFIHFRGSAPQLTALAAGELDLAVLAFSTFAGGVVNARQDIVGLADVARDGPGFSNIFGVLQDSPIKSVKDLKGKVLAINAKGGAVDMAARTIMLQNGLKPGKDVTIVEARFGAMEAMLRQGKIDVATLIAPFWARANAKGGVRALFSQKDGLGDTQFLFYVAQRKFVQKNRAAVVDWLEDYVRGTGWMLDSKNRDQMLDMTAKFTKRKKRIYAGWAMLAGKDLYHDPKGRLDLAALQRNVDTLHKLGILRRSFDVTTQVDESLVIEAAARLK